MSHVLFHTSVKHILHTHTHTYITDSPEQTHQSHSHVESYSGRLPGVTEA